MFGDTPPARSKVSGISLVIYDIARMHCETKG